MNSVLLGHFYLLLLQWLRKKQYCFPHVHSDAEVTKYGSIFSSTLRSVTQSISCMEIKTTRRERLGKNGIFSVKLTLSTSLPPSPFFSPFSLRGSSWKTAGPHIPTSLWEQQRSTQHWQHAEHSLFQQQCNLTGESNTEEQHRSAEVQRTVCCWHQRFNALSLVPLWKREDRLFYRKKDWFSFGEATMCMCVYTCTQCMGKHSLLDL